MTLTGLTKREYELVPRLLSREDAAELLGISVVTLDRMIKEQELPAVRVGKRRVMVRADQLNAYLTLNSTAPPIQEWAYQGDEEE